MKTRSYLCQSQTCNKSFRTEESLSKHMKTHENEITRDPKDFKCYVCSRVLSTKQSLTEHSFTHKAKKHFRCSEVGCGKMFRQNSQLCNHRKLHKIEKKKQRKERNLNKEERKEDDKGEIILPLITGPVFDVVLPRFDFIK